MNTDFPLKAQDAIIGDVIIYPEMDMSRTVHFDAMLVLLSSPLTSH